MNRRGITAWSASSSLPTPLSEVNIHLPALGTLVHTIDTLYEQAFLSLLARKNSCWTEDIPERARQPYHHRRRETGRQPAAAKTRSAENLIAYGSNHPAFLFVLQRFHRRHHQLPGWTKDWMKSYRNGNCFSQVPEKGLSLSTSLTASSASATDITGNTHRSEFCIDKLYSPDTAAGGWHSQFRAFDMPPHRG